jgi:hypothetical protein
MAPRTVIVRMRVSISTTQRRSKLADIRFSHRRSSLVGSPAAKYDTVGSETQNMERHKERRIGADGAGRILLASSRGI